MSKGKDFEYEGHIDHNHQNEGGKSNIKPQKDTSDNYDGASSHNQGNHGTQSSMPDIKQHENDTPSDYDSKDNQLHPDRNQNIHPHNNDTKKEDDQNHDSENNLNDDKDLDESNQTTPDFDSNNQQGDIEDSENPQSSKNESDLKENNSNNDNDEESSNDNDKSDNNENENNPTDEDIDNDQLEQEKGDNDSLASKATNKIAPEIDKASKLKDLASMSKEDAKEEVIEITKSFAKKRAAEVIVTYILPTVLPIIAVILVVLILIFGVLAATSTVNQPKSNKKAGCSPQDTESVSIKDSKDAEKNAKAIYDHEMKEVKGAKPKAVAAHLGNIYVESNRTFDPKTIQGGNEFKKDLAMDPSVGGYAFGLAQWDSGRRVNLIKYAKSKNKDWSDFGTQIDFMLNHDGADSDTIKKILKEDGDINEITTKIMDDWERAGDKSSISERTSAASKYYAKFSKTSPDSDSNIDDSTDSATDNSDAGSNSGCNGDSASKTDGELGASTKANDKSGKIKKQWKSKSEIPEKYKKAIELPDFDEKYLKNSPFEANGMDKGQCTELTWAYMNQLYKKDQPAFEGRTNGDIVYKMYQRHGAKVTANPTVGYGFSSDPPYAGATLEGIGHTGVVVGVMDNGDWICANYNLNGEGNNGKKRVLTYALVDGNKKSGGVKFFSGVGEPRIKSKK